MKPYPKKGLPPKKKPKRIRQRSAKKLAEMQIRDDLKIELLRERGTNCQARIPGVCLGVWSQMHEVKRRAQLGSPVDKKNIKCLCYPCHVWVHGNIENAQDLGLLERQKPKVEICYT